MGNMPNLNKGVNMSQTWKLDPKARYIVRRREGEAPALFLWTPTLAQKKGFYPVSFKEAEAIKRAEDKAIAAKKAARYDYPVNIEEDNPVTAAIEEAGETAPKEGGEKLEVTNEDLLAKELTKLDTFGSPDDIEEYFLLKYRVELTGDQDLASIKKEAAKTLTQLANNNSLYEVHK